MVTKKERAADFLNRIMERFPDAKIELTYQKNDPFTLLVAVLLSAQTTDVNVNKATPGLFKRFPDAQSFAKASPQEIEPYIKSLGFFRNKAKAIHETAQIIMRDFGGKIPEERELLETLPGVGKKTAAVVVANVFGVPAIAVDTHVARVSQRMGLTKETNPDKIEAALTHLLPKNRLIDAHHTLIWHGRRICKAQKPLCSECPIKDDCPKIGVTKSA